MSTATSTAVAENPRAASPATSTFLHGRNLLLAVAVGPLLGALSLSGPLWAFAEAPELPDVLIAVTWLATISALVFLLFGGVVDVLAVLVRRWARRQISPWWYRGVLAVMLGVTYLALFPAPIRWPERAAITVVAVALGLLPRPRAIRPR